MKTLCVVLLAFSTVFGAQAQTAGPLRVRVSQGVLESLNIKKVPPTYPPLARAAGIRGSVVLQIVVGTDGTVKELKPVSGHPMLIPAATGAVKQWKYKPYLLDGAPVEVESQVIVAFALAG